MISLTRLSGAEFVINSDLIERVDKTPDTVVTLTTGSKYVVAESLGAVVAEIRLHRAEVIALSELVHVDPTLLGQDDRSAADSRPRREPAERTLASVTPHPAGLNSPEGSV
ncbi:flagellar FlbD family protein [Nocardioides pantholopis]|uniref:flagellar FlbD family protein n=1 Tax=Nocardioides pantholopis TaxID=2483798 RepID=UPI000F07B326|nr:flagellar FlbD family protein [Nocardioides pantholopis]